MKIALFHYHLKPGGVTDVIIHSVRALLKHKKDVEEIRLVVGNDEGLHNAADRICEDLPHTEADRLRHDVLPEIGYSEEGVLPEKGRLIERLEARYDEDTLWWIHNYHLGKNPVFTAAVTEIARQGRRRMLLHIHDFPECGRPENLRRLGKHLSEPPYPYGPWIRYALINERDRKILSDAGLGEAASLLPNPVSLSPVPQANPAEVRAALRECCAKDNPAYNPDAPLMLYPVRAIRRKNIFEAALLLRMLDEPANLILTLPGVSSAEAAYSESVRDAFNKGLIPGVWCPESSGDSRLSYSSLISSSDAVISSSVQEGFGYLFLNALHWRKPLLARYLDILDGVLDIFGEYPRRFWADFRVPDEPALVERTRAAYTEKLKAVQSALPDKAVKSINAAITKIAAGGGIDVSFLSSDDQKEALKRAKEDLEWLETARGLNRELLDSVGRTIRAICPDMDRIIEARFGETAYIGRLNAAISTMGRKLPSASAAKIQDSVHKAFGRIDTMRLLYD